MNRMEMFAELKKDPSKRFKVGELIFFVDKDGDLAVEDAFCDEVIKVKHINFQSKIEYTEIEKPFTDRVKDGDVFFYFSTDFTVILDVWEEGYEERLQLESGNFFESKEKCEEAIRKIKEVLKGE